MSRPFAIDLSEGTNMPPLFYETAAWLRFYSRLPVPPLPGESDAAAAPDPTRTAYAAPIAGAVIGLAGGLVLSIAIALGTPNFLAAAICVLALMALTGGQQETAVGSTAGRRAAAQYVQYGVIAIAAVVLLRAGAIDALLGYGVWKAVFTIAGACAVSRAAVLAFTIMRPAANDGASPAIEGTALQWLAIAGLAIGIAAVLPFHGFGAAIAGIAAAVGAVAIVSAFISRDAGETARDFTAPAELLSEIAFLIAVLAFATNA